MGNKMIRLKSVVLTCALMLGKSAECNDLKQYSLDEKVARSDLVVIGKIVAIDLNANHGGWVTKYAHVEVVTVLKGDSVNTVDVEYRGPISEANPECCILGDHYLFFLKKPNDYLYMPVNEKFGIYHLPTAMTNRQ